MMITGTYSNGAIETKVYPGDWRTFRAFPDCAKCEGKGYTETIDHFYSHSRDQCPDCDLRFGTKQAIKFRIELVIAAVKGTVNQAKRAGTPLTGSALEDFNVNHPLAKEYRRLLKAWWGYVAPEFTPAAA